eukprot:Sspe_Gene.36111::Locus_17471_Transcript_1_1_Confidence_1.000_Length_1408::g.36111::m.36111
MRCTRAARVLPASKKLPFGDMVLVNKLVSELRPPRDKGDIERQVKVKHANYARNHRPMASSYEKKLFRDHNLTPVGVDKFVNVLHAVTMNITKTNARIQPDFLKLWQNTRVRRFEDPSVSLVTTHINFSSYATVVLLLNSHPNYRHGRLVINDRELMLFNEDGAFSEYDPARLEAVTKQFVKMWKKVRPSCVYGPREQPLDRLRSNEKEIRADLAGAGAPAHPFAETDDYGGGIDLTELPESVVYAEYEQQQHKLQREASPPATLEEGNGLTVEELIRPTVATFLMPFMHFSIPRKYLLCLPPSTVDRETVQTFDIPTESFAMKSFPYYVKPDEYSLPARTIFPRPPDQLAQQERPVGLGYKFLESPNRKVWNLSKTTQREPWTPRWNGRDLRRRPDTVVAGEVPDGMKPMSDEDRARLLASPPPAAPL